MWACFIIRLQKCKTYFLVLSNRLPRRRGNILCRKFNKCAIIPIFIRIFHCIWYRDYKRITSFATAANPNHISVSSTDRTVLIDLRMISRPMFLGLWRFHSEPPCHSEVLSLGTDMDAIMTWNRNQGDIVLYPYTSKPTKTSAFPLTVLASLQDPTSSLKSFPSASSPFLKPFRANMPCPSSTSHAFPPP
ncbi:hypothetical protein BC829DRAFT_50755 [Chytridium lagenaria]|nr:hypothetical protein BC829DRAFT_50755 [Chytridium lagenaria]